MMRRGPFTAVKEGDYYNCSFGYNAEMISFIKGTVPRRLRWWDSSSHFWTVHGNYLETVLEQARYQGYSVHVEHPAGARDDDNDDDDYTPPPPASSGDVTTDFAHLLSFDALARAYKQAALECHPDRPDGNAEAMKKLNGVWDMVKKKFGK